jgi:15-cis-phytoene synthase
MSARAEGSPARALARLYCPSAHRPVFRALLGLEAQIRAGIYPHLEHAVAHTRLAWWREECGRLARGAPLHPLTHELGERFGAASGAALAGVTGFVDLAAWDLAAATFASRREREGYAARWSAAFVAPLAHLALAGAESERALALGARLSELELLNALSADARAGRLRLPLDELSAAGVRPEELSTAHWGARLSALAREQHAQARVRLATAVAALAAHEQRALRALLVWSALAHAHSLRVSAALPRASSPGEHSTPLDGWRAWRSARRADAGTLRLIG